MQPDAQYHKNTRRSPLSVITIVYSEVIDLTSSLGRMENMCLPTQHKIHISLFRANAETSRAVMDTLWYSTACAMVSCSWLWPVFLYSLLRETYVEIGSVFMQRSEAQRRRPIIYANMLHYVLALYVINSMPWCLLVREIETEIVRLRVTTLAAGGEQKTAR